MGFFWFGVFFFFGTSAFFRPPGQDSGDSSFCRGSALHPCAPSKGFALELMRRDSFPRGDVVGGSSACSFSTREPEHPSPAVMEVEGGREAGRNDAAVHQPVTPVSFITSPVSQHPSKLYQPHPLFVCLFLHLSPADNMNNWNFSCTGGSLGRAELTQQEQSSVMPNSPVLPVAGPQQQQSWQGGGLFHPLQPCCSFTSVPALPLQKQAPGLP